tara:strand:+ start:333 stop:749 length:417 start_codon:yes stop_codon:yes gene_type:complete
MELKINILELASELAHEQVVKEMDSTGSAIYQIDSSGDERYTEEAQDEFNDWYDHYWTIIEKASIYPFKEGESYYTILKYKDKVYNLHEYKVIESCWDDQSEEYYRADPRRKLFESSTEALAYIDVLKNKKQIEELKK